jgi:hypothetical protein
VARHCPRFVHRRHAPGSLALRAGYICSFEDCGKPTAGPSEESSKAVTIIGEAAHISGAASGKGSRRYLAAMTSEERSSIDNAIWLCPDHARQIDRDEVSYTIQALRAMKLAHETLQAIAVRTGANRELGKGLLAIGPDVVCMGDIENVSAGSWTLSLKHFVIGGAHELVAFIDHFAGVAAQDREGWSRLAGTTKRAFACPDFLQSGTRRGQLCAAFFTESRMQFGGPPSSTGDPGSVYTNCETAIAR